MLKGKWENKKRKNVKSFYKKQKCTKKSKMLRSAKKSSREKDLKRDQSQNKNPSYDKK